METDDEREVRLERHRQREIRDVETTEQREERLKIMWERPIERTAMETAEQRDLNFGSNEMTLAAFFPSVIFPLKYHQGFSYLPLLVKPPPPFRELWRLNAPPCLTHRTLFSVAVEVAHNLVLQPHLFM